MNVKKTIATSVMLLILNISAVAAEEMWVKTERANRRSCPSTTCGVVGKLYFREIAEVKERKNGWARTTKYYDGFCEDGISKYVEKGINACVSKNGFVDGQFAEWVNLDLLTTVRPPDPAATASEEDRLIAKSDDYPKYRVKFLAASKELMEARVCSATDFIEQGGFVESQSRGPGIYFINCGANFRKAYLDVNSGHLEY